MQFKGWIGPVNLFEPVAVSSPTLRNRRSHPLLSAFFFNAYKLSLSALALGVGIYRQYERAVEANCNLARAELREVRQRIAPYASGPDRLVLSYRRV